MNIVRTSHLTNSPIYDIHDEPVTLLLITELINKFLLNFYLNFSPPWICYEIIMNFHSAIKFIANFWNAWIINPCIYFFHAILSNVFSK